MTKEQRNESARNHRKTWKALFGVYSIKGMVLHHKDPALKHRDIERYIKWLPQDLELLTKSEHMKFHHTGTRHTQQTKDKMSESHRGRHHTEIQKLRMSESHKRHWAIKKAKAQLQLCTALSELKRLGLYGR